MLPKERRRLPVVCENADLRAPSAVHPVRRIRRSCVPGSGECIFTSILNDTIDGILARIPSGHSDENRLLARLSADNCSQALGNALRLLGARIHHEHADLCFTDHAREI